MNNIQLLIKALKNENIQLKIEDEKVCNNSLNALSYEDTQLKFWMDDKASLRFCWDGDLMVGGYNGGIKTDKLSETIRFIIDYIRKYY